MCNKSTRIFNNNYQKPLMVSFAWSNDLESYVGGSVATGRTSHSR